MVAAGEIKLLLPFSSKGSIHSFDRCGPEKMSFSPLRIAPLAFDTSECLITDIFMSACVSL